MHIILLGPTVRPLIPELTDFQPLHPASSKTVETSPGDWKKKRFWLLIKDRRNRLLRTKLLFPLLILPPFLPVKFSPSLYFLLDHVKLYLFLFFSFVLFLLLLSSAYSFNLYFSFHSIWHCYAAFSFISVPFPSFLCCLLCLGYSWVHYIYPSISLF